MEPTPPSPPPRAVSANLGREGLPLNEGLAHSVAAFVAGLVVAPLGAGVFTASVAPLGGYRTVAGCVAIFASVASALLALNLLGYGLARRSRRRVAQNSPRTNTRWLDAGYLGGLVGLLGVGPSKMHAHHHRSAVAAQATWTALLAALLVFLIRVGAFLPQRSRGVEAARSVALALPATLASGFLVSQVVRGQGMWRYWIGKLDWRGNSALAPLAHSSGAVLLTLLAFWFLVFFALRLRSSSQP